MSHSLLAAPSERRRGAHPALTISLALSCACSAPRTASLTDAEVATAVAGRAADPADVARALELADVGPLAVPVPAAPAGITADESAFWRACAFAWNPDVRQSRRRVLAARARTRSAGASEPIALEVEAQDIGGPERETRLALTFDLLGILGAGRARAARELADAETRAALAELETAVWRAGFDADRGRVRLSAARAAEMTLELLLEEALLDTPRVELLADRGWIAPADVHTSRLIVHMLEHRISEARARTAAAAAELARVAGVPSEHSALGAVTAAAVESYRPDAVDWTEPDALALLSDVPELRASRLACALAEARLRRVAAERWPDLRLGPAAMFVPGDVMPGAMAEVARAFPGSLDGETGAALEECHAAADALEDALLATQARVRAARVALLEAIEQLEIHAESTNLTAARAWVAARARFAADPAALAEWTMALERRTNALAALLDARERFALARIDFDQVRGAFTSAAPGEEDAP
jgi:hypothetical protein